MAEKKQGEMVQAPGNPPAEVIGRLVDMAKLIPDGSQDTGLTALLAQVERAGSAEELSAAWDTTGGEALIGKRLRIMSLKRLQSDFADGLGLFLVVTAVDTKTGEVVTFTTGSVAIVAQLIVANARNWLPIEAEVVKSDRPTPDGYYPQHLHVFGRYGDL